MKNTNPLSAPINSSGEQVCVLDGCLVRVKYKDCPDKDAVMQTSGASCSIRTGATTLPPRTGCEIMQAEHLENHNRGQAAKIRHIKMRCV